MHYAINPDCIAEMVDTFYTQIRADHLLGPIFDAAIQDRWPAHLRKMKAFWASVLLASQTYKGNPMMTHLQLPLLTQRHFDRWLELWRETAYALCAPPVADLFIQRAGTIAATLLRAITAYHATGSEQISSAPQAAL